MAREETGHLRVGGREGNSEHEGKGQWEGMWAREGAGDGGKLREHGLPCHG